MMDMKILQIAHGRIYPPYSSAYALRCYSLFEGKDRKIISVGGYVFRDLIYKEFEQYRSIIYTFYSFIKKERYFEIGISRSPLVRKRFKKRLRELVKNYDIIVFEGPWSYPIVEDLLSNKFVVYDAHNVEYLLRNNNRYQKETYEIEKSVVERADVIFALSKEDIESIVKIYGKERERIIYVPHVNKIPEYKWHGEDSKDFVFIGSPYQPNIEALRIIENLAEKFPEFNFHIIGDFSKIPKKKLKNMIYHGLLDEDKKAEIFNSCLAGLNPVLRGGGRNIKMVDYLSHGLPVITTPIGFRGFDSEFWKDLVYIVDVEKFPETIEYVYNNRKKLKEISENIYKKYIELYRIESSIDPYNELMRYFK